MGCAQGDGGPPLRGDETQPLGDQPVRARARVRVPSPRIGRGGGVARRLRNRADLGDVRGGVTPHRPEDRAQGTQRQPQRAHHASPGRHERRRDTPRRRVRRVPHPSAPRLERRRPRRSLQTSRPAPTAPADAAWHDPQRASRPRRGHRVVQPDILHVQLHVAVPQTQGDGGFSRDVRVIRVGARRVHVRISHVGLGRYRRRGRDEVLELLGVAAGSVHGMQRAVEARGCLLVPSVLGNQPRVLVRRHAHPAGLGPCLAAVPDNSGVLRLRRDVRRAGDRDRVERRQVVRTRRERAGVRRGGERTGETG